MIFGRTILITAALAAAVFISVGAETPEEEIDRNIARLGAEKYEDRLVAESVLREIGPEAALRYDPVTDGADPEVSMRMNELLEAWRISMSAASLPAEGRCRLAPWVSLDGLRWAEVTRLDDDRVQPWLLAQVGDAESARRELLEVHPRHPSEQDILRLLARNASETIRLLSRRRRLRVSGEAAKELRGAAHRFAAGSGAAAAGACVLLVRLGEPPHAAVRAIREFRVKPADLMPLVGVREVCVAAGEWSWGTEDIGDFPATEFLGRYLVAGDADRIANLPSEFAEFGLRQLLSQGKPHFRASVYLNARGLAMPGLELVFDSDVTDKQPGPGESFAEALERCAPVIPGKRVEARLRSVIERADWPAQAVLLRVLAARRRERDITFIYVKMKALPPSYQPEVAVALAKLGSAAGIGLLVNHLTGLDPETADSSADAIRRITGRDFGFDAGDDLRTRCRAARAAKRWWEENKRTFHPDADKIGR